MENNDNIYNNLIKKLRDTKPEISDAEEFTDFIMNSLQKEPVKSVNNYKRIVVWSRPVMTAAALFLFGLFLFQQLDETDVPLGSSLAYRENLKPNPIIRNCFAEGQKTGNKYKSPFSMYYCYVRQTELANKRFNIILMEQFSKYQTELRYK